MQQRIAKHVAQAPPECLRRLLRLLFLKEEAPEETLIPEIRRALKGRLRVLECRSDFSSRRERRGQTQLPGRALGMIFKASRELGLSVTRPPQRHQQLS